MSETLPYENPLIPNKKLRQMYLAMVEARYLNEFVAEPRPGKKDARQLDSTYGQEACRVSTGIELGPGDLVSDAHRTVVMDLLWGADAPSLLTRADALLSNGETDKESRQLPWMEDVITRLWMALGAAQAFKALGQPNLVVAYVRDRDARGHMWKRILTMAARLELPIIFVALPAVESGKKKQGRGDRVGVTARSCGAPGIAVDASDAVALYRVTQESIGRVRGGGGPVVIDCVRDGSQGGAVDPIEQMKSFMLGRKVCSQAWLDRGGDSFRERIAIAAKSRRGSARRGRGA